MLSDSILKNKVHTYLEVFYKTHDFSRLTEIFTPDLIFQGPFFEFTSAVDYINSLKNKPPIGCTFELLHIVEENNQGVAVYEFNKGTIKTLMIQYFYFTDNLIDKIQLVFDTKDFEVE